MNIKTLILLAAVSGSSIATFGSPAGKMNDDVQVDAVRSHSQRHHHWRHEDPIVRHAPPPYRREFRGHRPHRHAVWVDGYWTRHRGRYLWTPGYWTRIPPGRHAWVQPRWGRRSGGYIYIDGYWR